jgi:hypothetical protein
LALQPAITFFTPTTIDNHRPGLIHERTKQQRLVPDLNSGRRSLGVHTFDSIRIKHGMVPAIDPRTEQASLAQSTG